MENNQFRIVILSIWWGAFTFYAGFVVPLGMKVLGSHTQMGMITQEVTVYLNIFSLILFLLYAFSLRNENSSSTGLVKQIVATSIIGFQVLLFLIHFYLTELIDFRYQKILSLDTFYLLHRIYLIIETIIWVSISAILFSLFKSTAN